MRLSAPGTWARLVAPLVIWLASAGGRATLAQTGFPPGVPNSPATRIVSIVPAATEMIFAVGAGPQVVAVSSFDHFPPAVDNLPRVGALLDPDTERILTLKPDLVVVYSSQSDLQAQLARVGIRTFVYRHGGVADTLKTIATIGAATGQDRRATDVATGIRARLEEIRRRVAGRTRPRTLLVIGRQPGALRAVYASGGAGFLHELLEVAGAANVFADVARESVQPSRETLLARAPEVIVELRPERTTVDGREVTRVWSALASAPAVRNGRVHALAGAYLVMAGPRLGDAAEALARAVHPEAWPPAPTDR
jgi:iron complex transport system substrate-binding protein